MQARVGGILYHEEPEVEEQTQGVEEVSKRSHWIFGLYACVCLVLAMPLTLLFFLGLIASVLGATNEAGFLGFGPIAFFLMCCGYVFSQWNQEEQQERKATTGLKYVFQEG